jgi:L-threonylcarbamoyladenylate synthase
MGMTRSDQSGAGTAQLSVRLQDAPAIRRAAAVLIDGGVVAYPTEAVWGLGCDPLNPVAVERLLSLKRRPPSKGLILVAADLEQIAWLLEGLTAAQLARLKLSWPGPVTWLIPHRGLLPEWVTGNHDTVAVRVSAHPVVAALCRAADMPLISTSANLSRAQAPRELFQVHRYFGDAVDFYVPGRVGGATRASTIRDLVTDAVIRA